VLGPAIYFDAPAQTLRVQVREDGLSIDQIVLSPVQYLTSAPGAAKNDVTILPENGAGAPVPLPDIPVSLTWTHVVNASTNGVEVWKSSGCGECPDAGAVSEQTVADAALTFSVTSGERLTVGLGRDTSASTSYGIDYSFSFNGVGGFQIRENAVYRREGPLSPGDVFKIAVAGMTVTYYRNGTLLYTSLVPATGPLFVDTSFSSIGAGVTSAVIVK
jgi:hypothetical protein